ncbi:membrane protein [Serratia marcescens]|nr:membrane protein [Serratia marcescens]
MSKPPLFFVAVIALIAVLAAQRYFKQRQQEAENDRAPMRSLQVTVNDKRSFPVAKTRAPQREPLVNEPMYYEVVFRPVQGGEDITLRLKQWQYNPIEKGSQGTLNMQGTRFVSFTVQP